MADQAYTAGQGGAWKHGLFDFDDIRTFVLSWFLAPCQIGQDRAAMNGRKSFTEEIVSDLLLPWLFPLCIAVVDRGAIRQKYNIAGSMVNDILVLWFCTPCALTQQTRELIDDNLPAQLFM